MISSIFKFNFLFFLFLLFSCNSPVVESDTIHFCEGDCHVDVESSSFLFVEKEGEEGKWFTFDVANLISFQPPLGAKPLYYSKAKEMLIASRVETDGVTLFLRSKTEEKEIVFPQKSILFSACHADDNTVWVLYSNREEFPIIKSVLSIFPFDNPEKGKSYLLSKSDGNRSQIRARSGVSIERRPFKLICHNRPLIAVNEWVSDLSMIHIYSFIPQKRLLRWQTGLSEINSNRKVSVNVTENGILQVFDGTTLHTLSSSDTFPHVARFDSSGQLLFSQDPANKTMLFIPKQENKKMVTGRVLLKE